MSKQLRVQWRCNGLSDFFRGIIAIHQQLADIEGLQITPCICSNNKFSEVFEYAEIIPHEYWQFDRALIDLGFTREPVHWNLVRTALDTCGRIAICSYMMPDLGRADIGGFKWLFTPKQSVQDIIGQRIRNIVTGGYEVIHVRVHMDELLSDHRDAEIEKALEHIDEVIRKTDVPIVLLSDDSRINELAPPSLLKSGITPSHSFRYGESVPEHEVLDILTDLWLIIGARKVTNITSFQWGASGFSLLPCCVFGIPYEGVRINLKSKELNPQEKKI